MARDGTRTITDEMASATASGIDRRERGEEQIPSLALDIWRKTFPSTKNAALFEMLEHAIATA
jgi:hypothetical protein